MAVIADLRALAHRHPDLAELGLGAAVGVGILLVSFSQWGLTDTGLARGLLLGIPFAVATSWSYRRRRQREERRERRLLEQRVDLARELHDAVAGQVAVVGIQAAAARRVLATRPDEAAQALERIETASRAAVADLRRMLVALREGTDDSSGVEVEAGLDDIGRLVADAEAGGLEVVVTARDSRNRGQRPPAVDHAAYRIVQEALTNAVRHGDTGRVTVDLIDRPGELDVRVRNPLRDGAIRATPGFGVRGMRERASLFDGELAAGPTPDGEWLVHARLRWSPEPPA